MPGSMSEADLVTDLKASLKDLAGIFIVAADADFKRHLATAALAMGEKRPRTLVGTLELVADQPDYAAPALFLAFKSSLWGVSPKARCHPWEPSWPGKLPEVRVFESAAAPVARKLRLDPAPSSFQINMLGAEFNFYYGAGHAVAAEAANTTISAGDRNLLILRAQVEALREAAMRNLVKPVVMRDGLSGMPKNGTPSFLHGALLQEWKEAA